MNQRDEVVLRKRFSRVQLLRFTANLKVRLIGVKACGGIAFSGTSVAVVRTRATADPSAIREALHQDEQERLHGRGVLSAKPEPTSGGISGASAYMPIAAMPVNSPRWDPRSF